MRNEKRPGQNIYSHNKDIIVPVIAGLAVASLISVAFRDHSPDNSNSDVVDVHQTAGDRPSATTTSPSVSATETATPQPTDTVIWFTPTSDHTMTPASTPSASETVQP